MGAKRRATDQIAIVEYMTVFEVTNNVAYTLSSSMKIQRNGSSPILDCLN